MIRWLLLSPCLWWINIIISFCASFHNLLGCLHYFLPEGVLPIYQALYLRCMPSPSNSVTAILPSHSIMILLLLVCSHCSLLLRWTCVCQLDTLADSLCHPHGDISEVVVNLTSLVKMLAWDIHHTQLIEREIFFCSFRIRTYPHADLYYIDLL